MKNIYLIRHCEAEGQPFEAPLTDRGLHQAIHLSEFFSDFPIDRIIASPFKRTLQSIEPFAKKINIEIETNEQLTERVLSTNNLPDWFAKLRDTFDDLELKFEGGESSNEAMKRIVEVVEGVFDSASHQNTIIVTHGNLLSLLLKHYNNNFGFEDWRNLRNPDVFVLKKENNIVTFERLEG